MEPIPALLTGLGCMAALSLAVLLFVRRPMRRILEELCGADHRAEFWLHLYEAGVILAVLFCALAWPPGEHEPVDFFDFLPMLRAGLFGLLSAMTLLAIVMMASISSFERKIDKSQPLPRDGNGAPLVRSS